MCLSATHKCGKKQTNQLIIRRKVLYDSFIFSKLESGALKNDDTKNKELFLFSGMQLPDIFPAWRAVQSASIVAMVSAYLFNLLTGKFLCQ